MLILVFAREDCKANMSRKSGLSEINQTNWLYRDITPGAKVQVSNLLSLKTGKNAENEMLKYEPESLYLHNLNNRRSIYT